MKNKNFAKVEIPIGMTHDKARAGTSVPAF